MFGEWNTSNLGDRAIHESVLRYCADCGWNAASFAIGTLQAVERGASAAVAVPPSRLRELLNAAPSFKRTLRGFRQQRRMSALLPALARSRAIIVGGGSLLSDWNQHFPQSLAALAAAARRLEKPLFCLGCGADGAWSPGGERKIRSFLTACSLVAARDEETAERIAQLLGQPIPVFGDFCLSLAPPPARAAGPGALALNVQLLPAPWHTQQARYEAAIEALARRIGRAAAPDPGRALRVFTTGSAEDRMPAQRVADRLGAELVVPRSLAELTGLLDASAVVVASRLHAGILALARGAAVMGFSPTPKLRRFFATLALGDYGFDLEGADRLLGRLGEAAPNVIAARQRSCLSQASIWACRARVRDRLQMLAATEESACTSRSI